MASSASDSYKDKDGKRPERESTFASSTAAHAKPTPRLHTLSELNEAGDEYLPAKIDRAGEKKVQPNGQLLDGRSYRVQTFTLPKRGDTLFMTEIECAKALGYRDISSLFNDNPTLYKVVADHDEKDHLIRYGILSHSDRDMEVAIVTAKSMFRCFGCQIIENGRRVRDDYWEKNAIKDGYTEEDIPPHPRRSQGTSTSRTRGESSVAKDSPTDDESAKLSEAQVSGGTARVWTTDLSDQTLTRVENRRWSRHVERISFALVEATGVKKWVERALQKYSLPELVRLTKPLLVIADEARSLDRELQFRKAAPGGLGSYMAEFGENLATHFWAAALAGTAMRLETTSPYYHDWKSLVRSSEFLVKNLRRKRMRDHYRSRAAGTIQEAHILKKFPGLDIGGPASSEWFAFLTRRLRREFYFNEAGRMAEIERCVKDSLSVQNPDICPSCCITPSNEPDSQAQKSVCGHDDALYDVAIRTDWSPTTFLLWQFGPEGGRLDSAVTITGSALYAYATTASTYMQIFWPKTQDSLLHCVQYEIDRQWDGDELPSDRYSRLFCHSGTLKCRLNHRSCVEIKIRATSGIIVELVQQLAWLSSTMVTASNI